MSSCDDCMFKMGEWWCNLFMRWRLWIRPFVILGYIIILIGLLPFLVINCFGTECNNQQRTILIGGIFALMALPINFYELTQHLVHYTKPDLQKHVIRILWMVPIYALDAWLGLLAPQYSIFANSLRETYEAYVIYNFMKFLLNYLNAEMDLEATLELKQQVKHLFPLCCIRDWEMGREFVHKCKHGILQYTVIRPITTAIAFICELCGVYGEDEFRADVAFPYIIAVNNISQGIAMYCLVLFYKASKDELAPMRPLGKFLCIKAVVFFSFFQGVAISILVNTGVITNQIFGTTDKTDVKDVSSSLQNFLICIEMFFAAIAHHYAFSYKAYIDLAADQPNCCESFCQMWDVSDVRKDLEEHYGVVKSTVKNVIPSKRVYRHPGGVRTERARLLSAGESTDYQSGSEEIIPSTSGVVRSASLTILAEISPISPTSPPSPDEQNFTDLTEDLISDSE